MVVDDDDLRLRRRSLRDIRWNQGLVVPCAIVILSGLDFLLNREDYHSTEDIVNGSRLIKAHEIV